MRALLDTSTLIAARLPDHVHHAATLPWLARAKAGAFEFVCSGLRLAEIYAVLTRLKRTPPIRPDEAWDLIRENVTTHARVSALTGAEYAVLIEDLARAGIMGATVYDAVIARVGELTAVDLLVTLNVADFRRVRPVRRGSCRPRRTRRLEAARPGRSLAKQKGMRHVAR